MERMTGVTRNAWSGGLFAVLLLALAASAAADERPVAPICLDALAAFAADRGVEFDAARVTFGPRWIGAGHEVRRVPGSTARIPVKNCGATLAVDLSDECAILKSRGEGACKSAFPLTFH